MKRTARGAETHRRIAKTIRKDTPFFDICTATVPKEKTMSIRASKCSTLSLMGALLMCGACSAVDSQPLARSGSVPAQTDPVKTASINLPPRTLFSIIGFDYKGTDESKEAQRIFRTQALPMAGEYGFERHGALLVTAVNAGEFKPQGFLLTSWPTQSAFDEFQEDPRWPRFEAIRPEIWNDIRYYRDVQENGLRLEIKSNRFYTLAIAHYDPDNPGDYQKYLSGLENEVAKNGGQFVLKLNAPKLESLTDESAPDQLTLIEWEDAGGVDRLLASEAYRANRRYAASGTTELAFYRLKPAL